MRVRAAEAMPRVFAQGPFKLQMGLSRLEPSTWLLVSEHYEAEIAEKRQLLAEGADVLRRLPEADAAVDETLALVADFMATHHPELPPPDETDPLRRLGLWVQEDLCWLAPSPDGHRLVAAFLAFPARWRLAEKIGRPLGAIHEPVPGFAERLGSPTERMFAGLAVERPVERANWSLVDDAALHQPQAKTRYRPPSLDAATVGEAMFLRAERQTLRRLPVTGVVLFTIHTFVAPLAHIAAEPTAAAALRARLAEMPAAMRRYKNLEAVLPTVDAWLTDRARGS